MPPVGTMVIEPSAMPKQLAGVATKELKPMVSGLPTVMVSITKQLLPSTMVTAQSPGHKSMRVESVLPSHQIKSKSPLPPSEYATSTMACPSQMLAQLASTCVYNDTIAGGSTRVKVPDNTQLLASVTLKVYDPASTSNKVGDICPVGVHW